MKVVGVDSKNKVVFVEGKIRDGIELAEYIDKGYKIIKVGKVRML
jgi:hypothetical protein